MGELSYKSVFHPSAYVFAVSAVRARHCIPTPFAVVESKVHQRRWTPLLKRDPEGPGGPLSEKCEK